MALDFPNSPTTGSIYAPAGGGAWMWDGVKWESVGVGGATHNVFVSDTAPATPNAGDMWFDSVGLQLYVFYRDPTSSQWVPANNLTWLPPTVTGTGSTYVMQARPTINQPVVMGITDGSNAIAGAVGEYLTNSSASAGIANGTWTSTAVLTLTPGDWECEGEIYYSPTVANNAGMYAGITNAINASPPTYGFITGTGVFGGIGILAPRTRFNVTASTTIYLNGYIYLGGGTTCNVNGNMNARRMR